MEWLGTVWKIIEGLPWGEIGLAFRRLVKKELAVVVVVIGLVICGTIFGYKYWHLSDVYQTAVARTLHKKLEETPEDYKGLDAFLLSQIPDDLKGKLEDSKLSPDFINQYEYFESLLDGCLKDSAAATSGIIQKLQYDSGDGANALITDGDPDSYLFFPVHLIRTPFTENEYSDLKTERSKAATAVIQKKLEEDGSLALDVALSEQVVSALTRFVRTTFVSGSDAPLASTPKQAYFITKNGVLRIVDKSRSASYFESQFRSTTFFPARQYFWSAFQKSPIDGDTEEFDRRLQGATVGSVFDVSEPYMDLAGNGIVVTACAALRRNMMPDSVVCMDLPLIGQDLEIYIRNRLTGVSNDVVSTECDGTDCSDTQAHSDDERELISRLSNFIQEKQNSITLDEVYGDIEVINSEDDPKGLLQVSVPVSPRSTLGSGSTQAKFVLFQLDLSRFGRIATLYGVASAGCVALAILILGASMADTVGGEIELREAFERVAEVMKSAPTPYSRLGDDDKIREANFAFCRLLGRAGTDEEVERLKRIKFRELCAPESIGTYDEVERKRKNHEPVKPYPLTLLTKDGRTQVMVHSAAIPSASPGQAGLPETFGIMLLQ